MINRYSSAWQIKLGLIIVWVLIYVSGYSTKVSAQSPSPLPTNNISKTVRVSFNLPPVKDNGAPGGRQKGAGSHGSCKVSNQQRDIAPLIALMPEIPIEKATKDKIYVWGRTTVAHPTFWFYVAYPPNTQVEFVLQDEEENELYQTSFTLNETPGALGLTLLHPEAALQVGKSYLWYFNIICDQESSVDDHVEGWVERVGLNPVINSQLNSAQPLERIAIYAQNGIWYDALTNLAKLRQRKPTDNTFAAIWTDLLQQVGLEEINQKPIVGYYDLEN